MPGIVMVLGSSLRISIFSIMSEIAQLPGYSLRVLACVQVFGVFSCVIGNAGGLLAALWGEEGDGAAS